MDPRLTLIQADTRRTELAARAANRPRRRSRTVRIPGTRPRARTAAPAGRSACAA